MSEERFRSERNQGGRYDEGRSRSGGERNQSEFNNQKDNHRDNYRDRGGRDNLEYRDRGGSREYDDRSRGRGQGRYGQSDRGRYRPNHRGDGNREVSSRSGERRSPVRSGFRDEPHRAQEENLNVVQQEETDIDDVFEHMSVEDIEEELSRLGLPTSFDSSKGKSTGESTNISFARLKTKRRYRRFIKHGHRS